ncbi:MAG: acylneuraminate cytidylyltransferase family protein [Acidobacteriota bacterium]|nr:acylneuraminate cytidylyltransferase family protein [Acidobacteriota bacterium]
MTPDTIAFIPARGGSKGVPGKNIRPLHGYPLMAYSIAAARMSSQIQRVVVSSDCEEICAIARAYGAETPFMRPAAAASDTATDRDVILHAMEWMWEHEGRVPEYWVYLRPTTPLRDARIIDAAVEEIKHKTEATSLRSGHPAPESPFKWFKKNAEGYFVGIDPTETRPEYYNLPRQAFEPVYIPNGYVDIVKASFAMNNTLLQGNHMIGFATPVVEEVDTLEQFSYLEYQIQKEGGPVFEFLKKSALDNI